MSELRHDWGPAPRWRSPHGMCEGGHTKSAGKHLKHTIRVMKQGHSLDSHATWRPHASTLKALAKQQRDGSRHAPGPRTGSTWPMASTRMPSKWNWWKYQSSQCSVSLCTAASVWSRSGRPDSRHSHCARHSAALRAGLAAPAGLAGASGMSHVGLQPASPPHSLWLPHARAPMACSAWNGRVGLGLGLGMLHAEL